MTRSFKKVEFVNTVCVLSVKVESRAKYPHLGVAHTAGFGLNQDPAHPERGNVDLFKRQRPSELLDNCGVQFGWHGNSSF